MSGVDASSDPAQQIVLDFVHAVERGDLDAMRALMSPGFRGYVTTSDGGVAAADRDAYVASVEMMDVRSAALRLDVPNLVTVGPGRVLVMVEVHAQRGGRTLHNHSGQLATVVDGQITELWMVDALPAESADFWSVPTDEG